MLIVYGKGVRDTQILKFYLPATSLHGECRSLPLLPIEQGANGIYRIGLKILLFIL